MEAHPFANHGDQLLLKLAFDCFSAALRFDYLSSGAGHGQSKAVLNKRTSRPRQASVPPPAAAEGGRGEPPAEDENPDTFAADPEAPAASAGDILHAYLRDVARLERLSSSEEYRLAVRARQGDAQAARNLVEHNLGLVVMIARRYAGSSLPLLDLIAEGNIGLIAALPRFDPELGFRFSTYAKWWVRQSIEIAVMTQSGTVRLPVRIARSLRQAGRAQADESEDVQDTEQAAERSERAGSAGSFLVHDTRQLEAPTRHDGDEAGNLLDTLTGPLDDEPEQRVHQVKRLASIEQMLALLDTNEQHVIRARFGLEDDEPQTLQRIATRLGLSGERIRQIESEALGKLRREFSSRGMDCSALM